MSFSAFNILECRSISFNILQYPSISLNILQYPFARPLGQGRVRASAWSWLPGGFDISYLVDMVSWWPPPPDYNQITQAILYSMSGIPMLSRPQEKSDWKSVFSTFLIDLDRIFLFKRLEIFAINEPTKPLSQSIQVSQHLTIKDGLAECA